MLSANSPQRRPRLHAADTIRRKDIEKQQDLRQQAEDFDKAVEQRMLQRQQKKDPLGKAEGRDTQGPSAAWRAARAAARAAPISPPGHSLTIVSSEQPPESSTPSQRTYGGTTLFSTGSASYHIEDCLTTNASDDLCAPPEQHVPAYDDQGDCLVMPLTHTCVRQPARRHKLCASHQRKTHFHRCCSAKIAQLHVTHAYTA